MWFRARDRAQKGNSVSPPCIFGDKCPVKSTDVPHRCVLEVASKNGFKTFRNRQALSKCLLKSNKIVKIEGKTSSKLFLCVLRKSV